MPSIITLWVLPVRKQWIQLPNFLVMSNVFSLFRTIQKSTLSKAFEKSRYITCTSSPSSKHKYFIKVFKKLAQCRLSTSKTMLEIIRFPSSFQKFNDPLSYYFFKHLYDTGSECYRPMVLYFSFVTSFMNWYYICWFINIINFWIVKDSLQNKYISSRSNNCSTITK